MDSPAPSDPLGPSLTPVQKDQWWLDHVYQGDRPQMTVRVVACGFLLGGVLAATNLYVGAKIGATLGTSITAVVLAMIVFGASHRAGWGRRLNELEGAIVQSVACSAGYMSSPLTASMAAYMVVTQTVVPWWQMVLWLMGIACLGVLFAIPLKRRFINHEEMPFPEGRACGVLLETLRDVESATPTAERGGGSPDKRIAAPGKLLAGCALAAGLIRLFQSQFLLDKLRLGLKAIPESLDAWYYRLAAKHDGWTPSISGIPLRELTIRPTLDLAVIALGGLMGIRTCLSLMIGAVANYCILAPWMVHRGDIARRIGDDGSVLVGYRAITTWSLWFGAALMTAAAVWPFLAEIRRYGAAVRRAIGGKGEAQADPLRRVEIPMRVFFAGLPVAAGAVLFMAAQFFGVPLWLGAVSIPLVFLLTIIAVNATGLTSMTPHGALGKVTQLACGVLAPRSITTNIVAASISAEVAHQASNFIQNVKPGYMVGAKPRLQAAGHLLGAVSGALAGVFVFYRVFLRDDPAGLIREDYPFPAVVVWKAVAEALTGGLAGLPTSALWAAATAIVLGVLMEVVRARTKGRFPLSPIGIGLAFVIPFDISLSLFMGALIFWLFARRASAGRGGVAEVLSRNQEIVCAGIVAGAAIASISVLALESF